MASIAMRTLSAMDRPWRREVERQRNGHRGLLHGGEHSRSLAADKAHLTGFHGLKFAPDLRGWGSTPMTRNSVASAPMSTLPSIRGSGGSLAASRLPSNSGTG